MPTPTLRLPLALALAAAPLFAQAPSAPSTAAPSAPPAPAPATPTAPAPQAPPDTEIYVADLTREGGTWRIERPRNVTRRRGYDNQPWFLPDGQRLLYASQRGEQTDVFELDLATGRERQLTATAESEYSPQLTLDRASVVVVRVEDAAANAASPGSAQRLWRFPLAGGAPAVVAPEVKGVGYQAWLDERTVAVFVLGEPFTLRIVELDEGGSASPSTTGGTVARIVANGVGRSIHRVPGTRQVSFTAPEGDARSIFTHDASTGANRKLAPAPPTQEGDYAWAPDGSLFASLGSTIVRAVPGAGAEWRPIADLAGDGVGKISRIAVSPLGDKVAFVAER